MTQLHATGDGQNLLRLAGLDAETVWDHPQIRVWRDIPERQNCTLDLTDADGQTARLHIKRFNPLGEQPARDEVKGIELLQSAGIPTVPLVAWSQNADGSGVVITRDLAGYSAGDKTTIPTARMLDPIARLAGKLHAAGLHHRDLYLCHFFISDTNPADVRLIDTARVRKLPAWPLRRRWIVKDLAQLWYSFGKLGADDYMYEELLARYAYTAGGCAVEPLRRRIVAKVDRIARHDANLIERQPARNISIPT